MNHIILHFQGKDIVTHVMIHAKNAMVKELINAQNATINFILNIILKAKAVAYHVKMTYAKFAKKNTMAIAVPNANPDIILMTIMIARNATKHAIHAPEQVNHSALHAKMGSTTQQTAKASTNALVAPTSAKSATDQISKTAKSAMTVTTSATTNASCAIQNAQLARKARLTARRARTASTSKEATASTAPTIARNARDRANTNARNVLKDQL